MSEPPSTVTSFDWLASQDDDVRLRPALVLLWSVEEPHRVGEVVLVRRAGVLGRGTGDDHLELARQRPGVHQPTGTIGGRALSRRQLAVRPVHEGLELQNIGRTPLRIGGRPTDGGVAAPGDIVALERKALFLVTMRPTRWPLPPGDAAPAGPFGKADDVGIVGESPAAWALRQQLAFLGPRDQHTLVLGPSGTGKELAARALHAWSGRKRGPWVARNASTLPEGLVDAELFGHVADYPNPGTPARPGLVGEADGGTLFLDEIGELPHGLQARLLRVLDAHGEYQRLGEPRRRHSDLRLVGATNRDVDELKHDLTARLTLRLELPTLTERREDVPLLVHHLLARAFRDADLAARFADDSGRPRVAPDLMEALVRHDYRLHVRELHGLLWASLSTSPAHFLALTDAVRQRLGPGEEGWQRWVGHDPGDIPADALQAALDAHNGQQEATWRALELDSRHQLARLVKKHGLTIRRRT